MAGNILSVIVDTSVSGELLGLFLTLDIFGSLRSLHIVAIQLVVSLLLGNRLFVVIILRAELITPLRAVNHHGIDTCGQVVDGLLDAVGSVILGNQQVLGQTVDVARI